MESKTIKLFKCLYAETDTNFINGDFHIYKKTFGEYFAVEFNTGNSKSTYYNPLTVF